MIIPAWVVRMVKDIVPELLEAIQRDFEQNRLHSQKVKQLIELLEKGNATYINANEYAIEIGKILSKVLQTNVTAEILPDGKMYFNIANKLLNKTLKNNHELIVDYASKVQGDLNSTANLRIKAQKPTFNQNRVDGLVNKMSSANNFDDVQWLFGEPIVNFSQSVVDDAIRTNVEFHSKIGMSPKIKRVAVGKACKWCRNLEGTYAYPDVPKDVYRRHENCRCMVDYFPGNGKKQNVWTKKIADARNSERRRKKQNEDIKTINRKADSIEYKNMISVLGADRMPVSLAKFQEMKYNDSERYERLKDNEYVLNKLSSGEWGKMINPDKQLPHMESTYTPGKSYIYDSVDVQSLLDKYSGTGKVEVDRKGRRTNKEIIELDFPIGMAVNEFSAVETNVIKIHHSEKRTHIVPKERK